MEAQQTTEAWDAGTTSPRADPDDHTGLWAYTESYAYDLVGSILEVQHQASSGNWTRHQYATDANRLLATRASTSTSTIRTAAGQK